MAQRQVERGRDRQGDRREGEETQYQTKVISSLRERVVTELLYETAMNRRESRRQVCCTVIVASIAVIAIFVGTS